MIESESIAISHTGPVSAMVDPTEGIRFVGETGRFDFL